MLHLTNERNDPFMALNNEQQAVFNKIMAGNSIFLTGNAGTGKSYLLNEVINQFKKQKKNFFVAAPTGIAAINVKGTTIHRLIGLTPRTDTTKDPTRAAYHRAEQLFTPKNNILIIDEISMCRVDIFSYLIKLIEHCELKFKFKMQLIIVGDFSQLSPFCGYNEKYLEKHLMTTYHGLYAFLSPQWQSRHLETCCLNHIVRQHDPNFVHALNQIRLGNPKGLDYINHRSNPFPIKDAITLCGRKRTVESKNQIALSKLPGDEYTFMAYASPKFSKSSQPSIPELNLKIGARVMITANGNQEQDDGRTVEYYNGQMATIKQIQYKHNHRWITINSTDNHTEDIKNEIKQSHGPVDKKILTKDTIEPATREEVKKQRAKQAQKFDFQAPKVSDDGEIGASQNHVIITLEDDAGHVFDITWQVWQEYTYKANEKGIVKKTSIGAYCQLPLTLAYAITIHKSQGQTFDSANFAPEVWADGQLYVALSRVRSVDRFYLERPLKEGLVKASDIVTQFYRDNQLFNVAPKGLKKETHKPFNRQPVINFLMNLSDEQFKNASRAMQYIFDPDLDISDPEQLKRFQAFAQKARN